MNHIFISYSHKDKAYVYKLKKALEQEGFDVWVDDRIDYGTTWPQVIQRNLDSCSAFIVVMTESAYDSKWVHNEVTRAERKKKPFFALLLSGDTWLSLEAVQYEDVTSGELPSEKFYKNLAQVAPQQKTYSPPKPLPPPRDPLWPRLLDQLKNMLLKALPFLKITGAFAFVAVAIWGATLLLPYIRSLIPSTTPEPSDTSAMNSDPIVTPGIEEIKDDKGVSMVLVPADDFMMGRDGGFTNERPAHTVTIDAFYIDKFEVTNSLYRVCDEEGDCSRPIYTNLYYGAVRSDRPVVYVTWDMANAYCQWRGARLPTEAEWEKAARGTDERPYPWGEQSPVVQYANYKGTDAKDVGSYPFVKSPYGAFDLAGNVSEWVTDWYSPDYYQTVFLNPIANPAGPSNSPYQSSHNFYGRVVRGGSWRSTEDYQLSTTYRDHAKPDSYADNLGFRCAKDAP